ncbi:NAD(P)-dependent alcohol dehydrogenase [Catellatospora citrea]|uniref:NADPH:quinone oxidoreductase n=1 Tax=Catellatospora citrea TaxID=53366 RepID=A0A8J3P1L6_9ACTN|nr:NAD(P)-dependent alcohol dehydrogenase [Catellatospora citrea]RKE12261.1 NADPH:quinone reductase-like Zn-dependent oxidoreductase [Catellatospora citrea]GIG00766.1 NADPH:quinone oxidoreductase [Catellatospora citrea]
MRAIVHTAYGSPDVLRLAEVDPPVPGDRDVLVKVVATTVTAAECAMRRGEPRWGRVILGFTRPRRRMRRLGMELAGEVAAVGAEVTRFRPGDRVFGFTGFGLGAYADYKCMPEQRSLAVMPANVTFEQAAAAVDGATTALFFLRDLARVRPGQRVLVVGASGSVGTYAVQLAKHLGAHVTGVCGTRNTALIAELGADRVIDYTKDDFTADGERYDVVFDTVGRSSFGASRAFLTARGCYAPTTGLRNVPLTWLTRLSGGRRVVGGMSVDKTELLVYVRDLIEQDRLRIVIDRTYPLEQIAEAHRYVDTGHKTGNVVITVGGGDIS